MTVATSRSALLTYDQAAELLGIQRASVKQLVTRGRLRSLPAPEDRRRRLLTRVEVEEYAREHAGKWSYEDAKGTHPAATAPTPAPELSKELILAGAASVGAAGLLIKAWSEEPELTAKVLIIGAIVAIALLLILEWRRQGKLNEAQARRLQNLAKQAESRPEQFIKEFEPLLTATP
jgi:excisionase family DNA binding protein